MPTVMPRGGDGPRGCGLACPRITRKVELHADKVACEAVARVCGCDKQLEHVHRKLPGTTIRLAKRGDGDGARPIDEHCQLEPV